MYISLECIKSSIESLDKINPFWGTSFLAFKSVNLPVDRPVHADIANAETDLLEKYYNPLPQSQYYYVPLRGSGPKNRWVSKRKYVASGLQKLRTTTFKDLFIHPREDQWAWAPNYLSQMSAFIKRKQNGIRMSAFHMAIWVFRNRDWPPGTKQSDIVGAFFAEFNISEEEQRIIFDLELDTLPVGKGLLQEAPLAWVELRGLTGAPQDLSPDEGGVLDFIELRNVGPASHIRLDFSERLNIVTGDNGSGKTFLLDCAWWMLTGQWLGTGWPAFPRLGGKRPTIRFQISGTSAKSKTVRFDEDKFTWIMPQDDLSSLPGIVLYSRVDGSFGLWDPVKHYWTNRGNRLGGGRTPKVFRFADNDVWDGLTIGSGAGTRQVVCNGLISDWVTWQYIEKDTFEVFSRVLRRLSPHLKAEPLLPGGTIKLPDDDRRIPTLRLPYGDIPIIYLSAGMKRILSIAYLLVWAWESHKQVSSQIGRKPQSRIVILVDEIEAHLHPQWQRVIVPALLDVIALLATTLQVQLIAATHSPLVMASIEPRFDQKMDRLFNLELTGRELAAREIPYIKQGSADSWLTSEVFDLQRAYSVEAEQALLDAKQLQMMEDPDPEKIKEVTERLIRYLPTPDEFWPRWRYFAVKHGVNL